MESAAKLECSNRALRLQQIWRHQATPSWEALSSRDKITAHYKRSLCRLFAQDRSLTHAIVLEDDLHLSPDFLSFILAFAPYTAAAVDAPAVISGWNDNAGAATAPLPSDVQLTSFFPGLGWLLPRAVWTQLASRWPPRRQGRAPPRLERNFAAASAAATGWDWWLRAEFAAYRWTILYPSIARVSHRGSTGANVVASQQRTQYAEKRIATRNEALSALQWSQTARAALARRPSEYAAYLRDIGARLEFEEADFASIAASMRLWPAPRGFLDGRLLLRHPNGSRLLLSRNAVRRARERRLRYPVLAPRNWSCSDTCGECVPSAIAAWNDCIAMAAQFGCVGGCVFETGVDLPAVVEVEAPLSTRGACVVAEHGADIGCEGRHAHTRRVCVCRDAPMLTVNNEDGEKTEL